MNQKILLVDDEPKILSALQRQLDEQFDITIAVEASAALEMMTSTNGFAVVVSDMRMPVMDGIQFLGEVKKRTPDSVRIMLTGCADFQTAVDAVNEGNIFRFLTKPCQPETLAKALQAGIRQNQLVTAEKELLEKTLSGSVKVLTDVLALVNPTAFGRASRVRRIARELAAELKVEKAWAVDLAAMLSQIGCVTLPSNVMDKLYAGKALTRDEARMLESHPAVGRSLVAHIPRLEGVAEIIACQEALFDGHAGSPSGKKGAEIPIGARILKSSLDFDVLTAGGLSGRDAMLTLRHRTGWYDPAVLNGLETVRGIEEVYETREVCVQDLTGQMIFDQDVKTVTGVLLVSKGNEVTQTLRQRLHNYVLSSQVLEPIRVMVKPERSDPVGNSPVDSAQRTVAHAGK